MKLILEGCIDILVFYGSNLLYYFSLLLFKIFLEKKIQFQQNKRIPLNIGSHTLVT